MEQAVDFKPKYIKLYNYSNDIKEIIEVDWRGFGKKGGRKGKKSNDVSLEDRERNLKRIKRNSRRLALANNLTVHMILTFKENLQDVDISDEYFKAFIKRLRETYPGIKYIATREYQKRGAIHYHVLINQRVDQKKVAKIWGHGFIKLVQHKNKLKAVMYVLKYINKDIVENKFITRNGYTKKAYLSSQGLRKEVEKSVMNFIITQSEDYIFFYNKVNMMMTNLTEGWDLRFEIDIKDEKPLECRSILKCANY